MEILKSGDDKDKARISFKLIDYQNTNAVSAEDFKKFLSDYFQSWASITNFEIT